MSDQFMRHAHQAQQQAHRQSVDRARQSHQDMMNRRAIEMQVVMDQHARRNRDPNQESPATVTGGSRAGAIARAVLVFVVLAALATGVYLLIRSGQLSDWLDLKDF
jgi:hypothetical protein